MKDNSCLYTELHWMYNWEGTNTILELYDFFWGGKKEVRMAGETTQCKRAFMGSFLDGHSVKSHGMAPR